MALLVSNSVHASHKTPLAFAPLLPRRSKWSKGAMDCAPMAVCARKTPPQLVRFTSPFFANGNTMRLWTSINQDSHLSNCGGGACASTCAISLSPEVLRWVFTAAAGLLMVLRNAALNKAFLVPLLALQAPRDAIAWIRGEYGLWAAFLALLVRLFYHIPGELELPLIFVLLVITAPHQFMEFRGTSGAALACAGAAVYLAYEHFSRAGGIKGAFQEGNFLASLAVILLLVVPVVFVFQGF